MVVVVAADEDYENCDKFIRKRDIYDGFDFT